MLVFIKLSLIFTLLLYAFAAVAGYSSWQQSRDGSTVCVGGLYSSWQQSRDGSSVAVRWDGD